MGVMGCKDTCLFLGKSLRVHEGATKENMGKRDDDGEREFCLQSYVSTGTERTKRLQEKDEEDREDYLEPYVSTAAKWNSG